MQDLSSAIESEVMRPAQACPQPPYRVGHAVYEAHGMGPHKWRRPIEPRAQDAGAARRRLRGPWERVASVARAGRLS